MNVQLVEQVIQEIARKGVKEFCVCPGSRNSPLVYAIARMYQASIYYWYEERSAAFFALGRAKATGSPVAVVTTSGTAAAELLPATMEAHYTGVPILLLTADRPRRFRGTGAPQSAEQVGLFGPYTCFAKDLAFDETCDLKTWLCDGPAHLNICFEEPSETECQKIAHCSEKAEPTSRLIKKHGTEECQSCLDFIRQVKCPLVVVGALQHDCKEAAIQFLLELKAPVYAEGISGLREDPRLAPLRIANIDQIWQQSVCCNYPIDSILRLGGVPTARLWRDLEDKQATLPVCSISEHPFSGLSRAGVIHVSLPTFLEELRAELEGMITHSFGCEKWLKTDRTLYQNLLELFHEEPLAEPSLVHQLSKQMPQQAMVYLGNSLPIREWDLAATYDHKNYHMHASRGLNGIDGQISTFLGLSVGKQNAWALLGDLTALYDMAGPWILPQLSNTQVNLAVINNSGGQIFSHMYSLPQFMNPHDLSFKHLAAFWKLDYQLWENGVPGEIAQTSDHRLIEVVPDPQATRRFWQKKHTLNTPIGD